MQTEKANANDSSDATVTKEPQSILLPVGTKVSINKTVLEGAISGYHLSTDGKIFSYLVEYTEDETSHEKAFLPNQIKELKSDKNGSN